MPDKIKYFTILGERCTGTHFMQHAILKNFHISYMKGEKHFFGNKEFRDAIQPPLDKMSLHEKQMRDIDAISPDEILVICIARDPVDWIDSFFKRKHHLPKENKDRIEKFMNNEFYSIYEEGEKKNQEIMEDRNWRTKERYANIFDSRKCKSEFMLDEVPKRYPHQIFLKYEDARDDYENTMQKIAAEFPLRRKHAHFEKVEKYKGTFNALYEKKPILLSLETQSEIWKRVDLDLEARIGYYPPEKR